MTQKTDLGDINSTWNKAMTYLIYVCLGCLCGCTVYPPLGLVAVIALLPCLPMIISGLVYAQAAKTSSGTTFKLLLLELSGRFNLLFLRYPGFNYPRIAAISYASLSLELLRHKGSDDKAVDAICKAEELAKKFNISEPIVRSVAVIVCERLSSTKRMPELELLSRRFIESSQAHEPLTTYSWLIYSLSLSLRNQQKVDETISLCQTHWTKLVHPYQHLLLQNMIGAMQTNDKRTKILSTLTDFLEHKLECVQVDIPAHELCLKAWLLNELAVKKQFDSACTRFVELVAIAKQVDLHQTDLNLLGTLATNTLLREREIWSEDEELAALSYLELVEKTPEDVAIKNQTVLLKELYRALNIYGQVLSRRKKWNEALQVQNRKLTLQTKLNDSDSSDLLRARLHVGRTLLKIGRVSEAAAELKAALLLEPTAKESPTKAPAVALTLLNLAEVNLTQGHLSDARANLEATGPLFEKLKADSLLPPIKMKVEGWIFMEEGNLAEAEKIFGDCIYEIAKRPELQPLLRDDLKDLFCKLLEKQKREKAADAFETLFKATVESPSTIAQVSKGIL